MPAAPEGQAGLDQARPLILEWHSLDAGEQAAEWRALADWVIWIHDLYELSREERLPLCWPQHPGLVEELRSLKAWREHLYDTPGTAGTPHAARSWHGELRQTITAALNFWAPGCRAGHTDADLLTDAAPELAEQWRSHQPPVMTSAPRPARAPAQARPPSAGGKTADTVSSADMDQALDAGTACLHSDAMPYYARYQQAWWTRSGDATRWDRCHDLAHAAHLDRTSRQLAAADAAADKHTHGKDDH
ncbi:hypothetical protein [Krasilnikovia sp. M28-CT-15]|uniref:hypothetical protein n=1 Tax=Krasilnikovia sp. M28-CT-15 TaxID=3373540 RepID=UPI00399D3F72